MLKESILKICNWNVDRQRSVGFSVVTHVAIRILMIDKLMIYLSIHKIVY